MEETFTADPFLFLYWKHNTLAVYNHKLSFNHVSIITKNFIVIAQFNFSGIVLSFCLKYLLFDVLLVIYNHFNITGNIKLFNK